MDKFDVACALLGLPKLTRGVRLAQDIIALVRLRNAITHFKPEWDNEDAAHADLSTLLRDRFSGSPFLTSDKRMFPLRWMTHPGTRWAVEATVAFLRSFENASGLNSKLDGFEDRLAS